MSGVRREMLGQVRQVMVFWAPHILTCRRSPSNSSIGDMTGPFLYLF